MSGSSRDRRQEVPRATAARPRRIARGRAGRRQALRLRRVRDASGRCAVERGAQKGRRRRRGARICWRPAQWKAAAPRRGECYVACCTARARAVAGRARPRRRTRVTGLASAGHARVARPVLLVSARRHVRAAPCRAVLRWRVYGTVYSPHVYSTQRRHARPAGVATAAPRGRGMSWTPCATRAAAETCLSRPAAAGGGPLNLCCTRTDRLSGDLVERGARGRGCVGRRCPRFSRFAWTSPQFNPRRSGLSHMSARTRDRGARFVVHDPAWNGWRSDGPEHAASLRTVPLRTVLFAQ